jgi:uncharacterized repeat protein (TIGR03803 family)
MKIVGAGFFAGVVGCALALSIPAAEAAHAKLKVLYSFGNGDPATGTETVLHSFGSSPDGTYPLASLVDVKGKLYGTTSEGGANCTDIGGCGTAFAIRPKSGAEKVLYSFCSETDCTDGEIPKASLIDVKGALYGTAYSGGAYGYGAAFAIPKP